MNMERTICGALLLITLASNICGCRLNYKALFYQAEENSNITVEWCFASKSGITVSSLKIHCVHLPDLKVFFQLDSSVKEDQDEQFAGRVLCDEEALTTGQVRLHLSRVRTDDSGKYLCRMATEFGRKVKEFALNIISATEEPRPVTEPPEPAGRDRTSVIIGLAVVGAAVAALAVSSFIRYWTSCCSTLPEYSRSSLLVV